MPISILKENQECDVIKVSGNDKTRNFLESLGIVPSCHIQVVSKTNNGLIVLVKGTRLAIDNNISKYIIVR